MSGKVYGAWDTCPTCGASVWVDSDSQTPDGRSCGGEGGLPEWIPAALVTLLVGVPTPVALGLFFGLWGGVIGSAMVVFLLLSVYAVEWGDSGTTSLEKAAFTAGLIGALILGPWVVLIAGAIYMIVLVFPALIWTLTHL